MKVTRAKEITTRKDEEALLGAEGIICSLLDESSKSASLDGDAATKGSTMKKALDVVSVEDAAKGKVSDITVVGNGNTFQLLCKASSKEQGWMKSAKAAQIDGIGCVVQVTTQQGDNVAEALTFVPGVKIADDENGGRKLVAF